jgi:hypothetical protein
MLSREDIEAIAPGFNDWLDGNDYENYGVTYERLCMTFAHLDAHDWKALMAWLQSAYKMGYEKGKEER